MKKDLFAEVMRSVGEAAEHARGKRDLRTTVLPEPPAEMSAADIRAMRKKLNASQAVFASCLNVSAQLVRAWEADRRHRMAQRFACSTLDVESRRSCSPRSLVVSR